MIPETNFAHILKAYKRVLDKPVTEVREAGICMRENSFYVDTVRRWAVWVSLHIILPFSPQPDRICKKNIDIN